MSDSDHRTWNSFLLELLLYSESSTSHESANEAGVPLSSGSVVGK